MQYPCTSCGACCRISPPPAFKRADGACQHYDDDTRRCGIYETRPMMCRVREGYELVYRPHFGQRAYWMTLARFCTSMEPEANVDLVGHVEQALQACGQDHGPEDVDMDLFMRVTMEALVREENQVCIPSVDSGQAVPAGPVNGH